MYLPYASARRSPWADPPAPAARHSHRARLPAEEHEDFISQIELACDGRTMLCAGGDGFLSAWNRKSGKLLAMSDQMEDELLSLQIIKGGAKIVCGTQSGTMHIWTWGDWGDVSDRMPGHPQSVMSMVKIDESTVITCSEDGIIRVVQIQPNKLLGVIGEHEGFPVECIDVSYDCSFLASCSHDNTVKFWGVAELYEEGGDEDDDDGSKEGMEEGEEGGGDPGMEVEEEGSEESWDSDDSEAPKSKKKKRGGNAGKKAGGGGGMKGCFYDDM